MGAISRVVSDTMIYPARRVKTTRQTLASRVASGQLTQKEADELLSRGTVGLITHIVKESGFMSLYVVRRLPPRTDSRQNSLCGVLCRRCVVSERVCVQGLGPELIRGMLSGAVMLMIKEQVHTLSRGLLLLLTGRLASA